MDSSTSGVKASALTLTEGELWTLIHKDFPFACERWEKLLTFGEIKVVVERALARGVAVGVEPYGYVMPENEENFAKFVTAEQYGKLHPAAKRQYTVPVYTAPGVTGREGQTFSPSGTAGSEPE